MTNQRTRRVKDRFILASASPRRRELLAAAGFDFEILSPDVRETESASLTLRELTLTNAFRKGRAVSRANAGRVVVAADTLVALEGEVIGKPENLRHARKILRQMSGRAHEVCSGVFVGDGEGERIFHVISHVRFRELTDAAISDYFSKINPLDKAGAYAAQGHGRDVIEGIEGSYTNVVGLPMEETIQALRDFGVVPGR